MSSILNKLRDSSAVDTSKDLEDFKGAGGFVKESGVYDCVINKAFLIEASSGAIGIYLNLGGEAQFETTEYISTRELKTYYSKNGKDFSLPSYIFAKKLNYLATGDVINSITDFKAENRLVKHYKLVEDPDNESKKKRVDSDLEAEVLTEWIGKEIKVAFQMCEKEKQIKQGDKYVSTGEIVTDKEGNPYLEPQIIDIFNVDGFTASELVENKPSETLAKVETRLEKNPVRKFRAKKPKSGASKPSTSGSKPVARPSVF